MTSTRDHEPSSAACETSPADPSRSGGHRLASPGPASAGVTVPPTVRALIRQGIAMVVATRDADMRPHIAQAWAPEILGETGPVRFCIDAPAGSPIAAGLVPGREIAATLTRPSTYRSVQLKGVILEHGSPTTAQGRLVDAHEARFVADVAAVGIPPRVARRRLDRSALVSVTFAPEAIYDQTPGPGAGAPLNER